MYRHTTRFILVYISFLPFALWRHLSWATLGVAPLISLLLCGIENIGVMIENPMRIMPMLGFCETIHADLLCVAGAWASGGYVRNSFYYFVVALLSSSMCWEERMLCFVSKGARNMFSLARSLLWRARTRHFGMFLVLTFAVMRCRMQTHW